MSIRTHKQKLIFLAFLHKRDQGLSWHKEALQNGPASLTLKDFVKWLALLQFGEPQVMYE